jgi:hypothetical protein
MTAYKLGRPKNSANGNDRGRPMKAVKIYSIRNMLPKKFRTGYTRKVVGDKLHLIKKEKKKWHINK